MLNVPATGRPALQWCLPLLPSKQCVRVRVCVFVRLGQTGKHTPIVLLLMEEEPL